MNAPVPHVPCDEKGQNLLFPTHETSGTKIEDDGAWRTVSGPSFPLTDLTPCVAVDFETYYSSSYSLRSLSTWEYVYNIAFDAYLVALEWFDGQTFRRWVGHPSKAPWHDVAGLTWLSHNAAFDELVFRRLIELGRVVTEARALVWECTADMSAFFQAGRSLERAGFVVFGESIDKTVRDQMKTGEATPEAMKDYAAGDSRVCLWLWLRLGPRWTEQERVFSRMTRYQGWRGIYADLDQIAESKAKLHAVKLTLQMKLPWGHKYSPTSPTAFNKACYEVGIIPPDSLAKASEDADQWHVKHGDKYPWIEWVRQYTQANQIDQALTVLADRRRKDGSVPFEMKYCGSPHTKRSQSSGGLRLLNLNRQTFEGVNIRSHLKPPPGHVFFLPDLSQIEPRVLHWLIGDNAFLDSCRAGISPYEAHARASMGFTGPGKLKDENPVQYSLAKARVLGLGFGAWADAFVRVAWSMAQLRLDKENRTYIFGDEVFTQKTFFSFLEKPDKRPDIYDAFCRREIQELPSAISTVTDYRESNPLVVNYWSYLETMAESCDGGDFFFTSPSGSEIRYFDVTVKRWQEDKVSRRGKEYTKDCKSIHAWLNKSSKNPKDLKNIYGGLLCENVVQHVAREVFVNRVVDILKIPDVWVNWTVHDEAICVLPEAVAEQRAAEILDIMQTAPEWATGLPIAAGGEIVDCYTK